MKNNATLDGANPTRLSEIFYLAADAVRHDRDFYPNVDVCVCMCDAIFRHAKEREYKEASALLLEYIGRDAIAAGPDTYRWGKNFGETPEEIRVCREVALLFMAAMVEAGDA